MTTIAATPFRKRPIFQVLYTVGIIIKGFDGLLEVVAGMAILVSPQLVHAALTALAGELGEYNAHVWQFVAEYIARVDSDLVRSGATFLITFLLVHGLVKLALVYCLFKEIIRAYPVALMVLLLFLLYQIYVLVVQPTIGMVVFTVLDAAIIWLVWGEYRDLRDKKMVQ